MLNVGNEIKDLLELIRLQNSYIQQVLPLIYHLSSNTSFITNNHYQKFTCHFLEFMHCHYNCEGCSQAAQLGQFYQYALWEKILDTQILSASEQLETAIEYLETAARSMSLQLQKQILLLNKNVLLLEDTQFRIIEKLEIIMVHCQPIPQFYN